MTIVPLKTYLRTHRKRTGFTHDEVAFLLGGMCGANVARHEKAKRLPALRTVLMYEFIFDVTVRELYEGVFHEMRIRVRGRARGLLSSLSKSPQSALRDQKMETLRRLLDAETEVVERRHA